YYINTTPNPTISDSKNNTWYSVSSSYYESGDGSHAGTRIYYAYNPTVGTNHTFSIAGTTVAGSFVVAAFSGATTADPKDQETGHTGGASGTSDQPGTITPSQN